MPKPNSYVLHEDRVRVVIATGFARPSKNPKTGDMIQVWILAKSQDPVTAVHSGRDAHVCGDCPLRGVKGKGPSRGSLPRLRLEVRNRE